MAMPMLLLLVALWLSTPMGSRSGQPAVNYKPLAVKLPSGLSTQTLDALRALRDTVASSERAIELQKTRSFGLSNDLESSGAPEDVAAETTFMHEHMDSLLPDLRPVLRQLADEASDQSGWGVLTGTVRARCLELIRYSSHEVDVDGVGWHGDIIAVEISLWDENTAVGTMILSTGQVTVPRS